jgi:archaellum component FlaC
MASHYPKETCPTCIKIVTNVDKGLQCSGMCKRWLHKDCIPMTAAVYKAYTNDSNKSWYCGRVDCVAQQSDSITTLSSKLDVILNSLSKLATKEELGIISKGVADIKADIKQLYEKIGDFEPRLTSVENEVQQLKSKLQDQHTQVAMENIMEEFNERNTRSRNVIAYGIEETSTESQEKSHDTNYVRLILEKAGLGNSLSKTLHFRLGKRTKSKPRPLKICTQSNTEATNIFRAFGTGNESDSQLQGISLSRDRTKSERDYLAGLRENLKFRMEAGETNLTIKYVNGTPKIVQKN